ncbi:hypothetical protein BH10ACT3_BH10ACT3_23200 [soil metagenome]
MFRLGQFRYDQQIPDGEVGFIHEDFGDEFVYMSRDEAIAFAHSKGLHLVERDPDQGDDDVWCQILPLTLPIRWETMPKPVYPVLDEAMWFEAECGGRDLLLKDNGHTFTGRMLAWCPHGDEPDSRRVYSVSLSDMAEMSTETRYFVHGFLAGNTPEGPFNEDWEMTDADAVAWQVASIRFRTTGEWSGHWSTCSTCGCVLLPDSWGDKCHEHGGP